MSKIIVTLIRLTFFPALGVYLNLTEESLQCKSLSIVVVNRINISPKTIIYKQNKKKENIVLMKRFWIR